MLNLYFRQSIVVEKSVFRLAGPVCRGRLPSCLSISSLILSHASVLRHTPERVGPPPADVTDQELI